MSLAVVETARGFPKWLSSLVSSPPRTMVLPKRYPVGSSLFQYAQPGPACLRNFLKIYFIYFLQRGRERDRDLETSMREKHRSAASCTPPTGDVPATKVHALDQNRTQDPSVRRPMLYPLSHTSQGCLRTFAWAVPSAWNTLPTENL
uniref:Uncharacterized protein n=1 Tax=Myotis myotis TaxID=51298 RepID=A0A7J7XI15_MYOMY|nr:hypothetical protein mMyoMyo1_011724 [Myotis myotis]